ncbi:nitric oxide reductase activation protein NorD [Rugamonas apoptosis]|uniref:VWA domain-containing protein n=1 Tax=Rugamonas apoptosis TaxID=2758570 RepID=A0A7W2F7U0_9BURK|nr:VWA domain-containing protein [Rugamonas apoptosis]MBA5686624.1 VWA domain-containing protein [Rugamonas apoptosis]
MAEAEDVITDAARIAFDYVQRVRQRKRGDGGEPGLALKSVAERLDLLCNAAFGRGFRFHAAQAPLPRTMLERLFRRGQAPAHSVALPATDGQAIWLPPLMRLDPGPAMERYRALALLQATRALRGAPAFGLRQDLAGALFHVCEAWVSDALLQHRFPGLRPVLAQLRADALAARPDPERLTGSVAWIEQAVLRALRGQPPIAGLATDPLALPSAALYQLAAQAVREQPHSQGALLHKDLWLGDFKQADAASTPLAGGHDAPPDTPRKPRSARLARRPQARPAQDGEDEQTSPGPFVLQTAQPQEKAEDPMGLQRPTDRDAETAADDFGDALSELPEARLVTTPGSPAEVLMSDEPIAGSSARQGTRHDSRKGGSYRYPEWDHRRQDYTAAGSIVWASQAEAGDPAVVARAVQQHAALLVALKRGFQMLSARRARYRRQLDGDDLDVDTWVDAESARRAGGAPDGRVFETQRLERRDLAVLVLVDVSGSTDGWITDQRRVIDVEREALLLVSHALDALGEPFGIQAFSGEGPDGVVVREIKDFKEPFGQPVALRIAGIEPEHYTRTGSAVRHAAACLAAQPARHRLLLLLTDGKPNDVDQYEGKYGLHDLRQAVVEARNSGVSPFCLTIDHQAAHYLGQVFGQHQFAILPRTELLATVLLTWLRKLVA